LLCFSHHRGTYLPIRQYHVHLYGDVSGNNLTDFFVENKLVMALYRPSRSSSLPDGLLSSRSSSLFVIANRNNSRLFQVAAGLTARRFHWQIFIAKCTSWYNLPVAPSIMQQLNKDFEFTTGAS